MSIFAKDKEYREDELFDLEEELEQEELEQEETEQEEQISFEQQKNVMEEPKLKIDMPMENLKGDPSANVPYVDEMGVIAKDTVIHGSVHTKGHLAVAGTVEGGVHCAGNLMLTGNVKGEVDCYNIVLGSNTSLPSLRVKENVSIKENIAFNGDILCNNISVLGRVNGNITANGNIGISKTAVIEGSITAKVIAIEPGAKIKGFINTLE